MDSIIAGLSALTGFAALQLANYYGPVSCLCPPLGAVAVLLSCHPKSPASETKTVIGAHVIAGLVGYAVVRSGFANYAEAIAVVLTVTAMSATKMVHPPAGAYVYWYVNKRMGLMGILRPGLVGAAVLVASQMMFNSTLKPLLTGKIDKKKKWF